MFPKQEEEVTMLHEPSLTIKKEVTQEVAMLNCINSSRRLVGCQQSGNKKLIKLCSKDFSAKKAPLVRTVLDCQINSTDVREPQEVYKRVVNPKIFRMHGFSSADCYDPILKDKNSLKAQNPGLIEVGFSFFEVRSEKLFEGRSIKAKKIAKERKRLGLVGPGLRWASRRKLDELKEIEDNYDPKRKLMKALTVRQREILYISPKKDLTQGSLRQQLLDKLNDNPYKSIFNVTISDHNKKSKKEPTKRRTPKITITFPMNYMESRDDVKQSMYNYVVYILGTFGENLKYSHLKRNDEDKYRAKAQEMIKNYKEAMTVKKTYTTILRSLERFIKKAKAGRKSNSMDSTNSEYINISNRDRYKNIKKEHVLDTLRELMTKDNNLDKSIMKDFNQLLLNTKIFNACMNKRKKLLKDKTLFSRSDKFIFMSGLLLAGDTRINTCSILYQMILKGGFLIENILSGLFDMILPVKKDKNFYVKRRFSAGRAAVAPGAMTLDGYLSTLASDRDKLFYNRDPVGFAKWFYEEEDQGRARDQLVDSRTVQNKKVTGSSKKKDSEDLLDLSIFSEMPDVQT